MRIWGIFGYFFGYPKSDDAGDIKKVQVENTEPVDNRVNKIQEIPLEPTQAGNIANYTAAINKPLSAENIDRKREALYAKIETNAFDNAFTQLIQNIDLEIASHEMKILLFEEYKKDPTRMSTYEIDSRGSELHFIRLIQETLDQLRLDIMELRIIKARIEHLSDTNKELARKLREKDPRLSRLCIDPEYKRSLIEVTPPPAAPSPPPLPTPQTTEKTVFPRIQKKNIPLPQASPKSLGDLMMEASEQKLRLRKTSQRKTLIPSTMPGESADKKIRLPNTLFEELKEKIATNTQFTKKGVAQTKYIPAANPIQETLETTISNRRQSLADSIIEENEDEDIWNNSVILNQPLTPPLYS